MRHYPLDYPKPSEFTLAQAAALLSFVLGALAFAPIVLLHLKSASPVTDVLICVWPVSFTLGMAAVYFYSTMSQPFVKFQEQIETFLRDGYGLEASSTALWRMSLRRNLSTVPNVGPSNEFRGWWAKITLPNGSKARLVLDIEADGSAQLLRKVGIFTYVPMPTR